MALRKFSLPIIFAVMLFFPQVFGRMLEEKPAASKKDANLNIDETKYAYGYHPYDQLPNEFNDDKQYGYRPGYGYGYRPKYGYGPGYGYRRPPPCYYRCGYRCCSAEEYAEFVQAGN